MVQPREVNRKLEQASPAMRFAEGFFNGLKFSFAHAFTIAPFYAKELSIHNKSSFLLEYVKQVGRASIFYTGMLSLTFGCR